MLAFLLFSALVIAAVTFGGVVLIPLLVMAGVIWLITLPFRLVFWLVAGLVWLMLVPLRLVFWLALLPFRLLRFA